MCDPAQFIMSVPPSAVAVAIIVTAFISEDAATLAAASLSATNALEPRLAFLSSVAGIWLGDLGLFAIAYRYGSAALESSWVARVARPDAIERGRKWFNRNNSMALFFSRCMPGTRLPVSLAAGTFRMRPAKFALVGAAGAIAWVSINFGVVHYSRNQLHGQIRIDGWWGLGFGGSLFVLLIAAQWMARRFLGAVKRWSRWEFWPAWLFYIPVVGMWAWLSVRHRGLSLPALANPSQKNGGLVGESKAEIIADLQSVAPEFTASAYLIDEGDLEFRVAQLLELILGGRLEFPMVIKPNQGQRGAGFRKIANAREGIDYLATVRSAVVAQQYVEGPYEAGIFYVRLPGQVRGEIFAITDKHFPEIVGDGRSTLEELVRSDARARIIARTYLRRFQQRKDEVLDAGARLRLVEAGNHCQGCIFGDGMHLYTEALRNRIDEISRAMPEFFIGRYDIRYTDEESLRRGEGFKIIELNGAASEATSIYDSRNSLWTAYRVLFRQWALVFRAGALNRQRGFVAPSLLQIGRDWLAYTRSADSYPLAD